MKKWLSLILCTLLLVTITACNTIAEPNITVVAQISQLSDEEYGSVGTSGLENPNKDDFRKFSLNFDAENLNGLKSRLIEIPNNWRNLINFDKDRYWYGSGEEQDNKDESFAHYKYEFVFYSNGLSDEDIRKAFDSAIITVSWVTKEGENAIIEYVIGDLIAFN
ncbi:fructose-bisphosphate aldolase [Psychrobacillus sp. NPDC096426]|uniref:fructose-bisphosphate aldolase n=1 Tax=Psychrobacillus sp. NPDC096426 TaxID=3364491 RepID=UPI00381CD09A